MSLLRELLLPREPLCASEGGVHHRTRADVAVIAGASIEGARSLAIPKMVMTARVRIHQSAASSHQSLPYEALPNTVGNKNLAIVGEEPCIRITSNTLPLVPLKAHVYTTDRANTARQTSQYWLRACGCRQIFRRLLPATASSTLKTCTS
jgi:hypothetical protein